MPKLDNLEISELLPFNERRGEKEEERSLMSMYTPASSKQVFDSKIMYEPWVTPLFPLTYNDLLQGFIHSPWLPPGVTALVTRQRALCLSFFLQVMTGRA